jgi:hypothetical protein
MRMSSLVPKRGLVPIWLAARCASLLSEGVTLGCTLSLSGSLASGSSRLHRPAPDGWRQFLLRWPSRSVSSARCFAESLAARTTGWSFLVAVISAAASVVAVPSGERSRLTMLAFAPLRDCPRFRSRPIVSTSVELGTDVPGVECATGRQVLGWVRILPRTPVTAARRAPPRPSSDAVPLLDLGGACAATREGRPQAAAPPVTSGPIRSATRQSDLPRLGRPQTRSARYVVALSVADREMILRALDDPQTDALAPRSASHRRGGPR